MNKIKLEEIAKVTFSQGISKERAYVTDIHGTELQFNRDNEGYANFRKHIITDANQRGLFALKSESGYSNRSYTYYVQPETKSKLSTSQANALRDLLNRELHDEFNMQKSKARWTNDQIHFKTRESLVKLGFIAHGKTDSDSIITVASFECDYMVLSEAGRAKAQELFPDLTIENLKSERETEQQLAQRRVETKRAIRQHFSSALNLSEVADSVTLEIARESGKIEDVKFHFMTSVGIGDTVDPRITVSYQRNGYKSTEGWVMNIIASQTYGIKTTHKTSAVLIDPLYMSEFVQMVNRANQLIERLNEQRPDDFIQEV